MEKIKRAYEVYKNNFSSIFMTSVLPSIIVTTIISVINFIVSLTTAVGSMPYLLNSDASYSELLYALSAGSGTLFNSILSIITSIATTFTTLISLIGIKSVVEKNPITLNEACHKASKLFGKYFVVTFIYGILIAFGGLLCIIPGILVILFLYPIHYIFLDETKNLSLIELFTYSCETMKGKIGTLILDLLLFAVIFIGVFLLSCLTCIGAPIAILLLPPIAQIYMFIWCKEELSNEYMY